MGGSVAGVAGADAVGAAGRTAFAPRISPRRTSPSPSSRWITPSSSSPIPTATGSTTPSSTCATTPGSTATWCTS
ncbi:hypothetical protein [Haloplanus litoreus]|uniref:hypothetical protein n=1 Tax=Haloplanus litoreus TaxID=767515 RepID=UPI003A91C97D